MNPSILVIVILSFFICSCSCYKDTPHPVKGSELISRTWKTASIKEHALILTPLKIADEAPDTYRNLMESSKSTKDANGNEILTIAGGSYCPNHKFNLARSAGKFSVTVLFEEEGWRPLTSTFVRQSNGWYHEKTSPDGFPY